MKPKVIRIATIPLSLNRLLRGQLKMLTEQYEVVAVASPGSELEEAGAREGVRCVPLSMERRMAPLSDLKSLWALIRLFRREKPDIVHSLTPKAGLLAMLAARITGVPVRIHTFTGLVFPTAKGLTRHIVMATDRLTCACATVVNPEGEGVKRDLERFGITRKPLQILAYGNINGVDTNYFSRSDEVMAEASRYRLPDVFTCCFVGRMVGDKGINELVAAFIRLYERLPKCRLLLIGPFEEELDPVLPETRRQILSHPGIQFFDWQEDIRPFLAASDLFVFPSYREGFPNVLLQAGAMGVPALVTDINGSNEIINNGVNGVIMPPCDEEALYQQLLLLTENPEKVHQMAAAAREQIITRFQQQVVWDELLNLYRKQI